MENRTGVFIISIVSIISAILSLFSSITGMGVSNKAITEREKVMGIKADYVRALLNHYYVINIVLCTIFLLISSSLFFGVYKMKSVFMLPWMIVDMFYLVVSNQT